MTLESTNLDLQTIGKVNNILTYLYKFHIFPLHIQNIIKIEINIDFFLEIHAPLQFWRSLEGMSSFTRGSHITTLAPEL